MDKENYIAAMNELLGELNPILGAETIASITEVFKGGGPHADILNFDHQQIRDIKIDWEPALALLIKNIYRHSPPQSDMVEMTILKVLWGRRIPVPGDSPP